MEQDLSEKKQELEQMATSCLAPAVPGLMASSRVSGCYREAKCTQEEAKVQT